MACHRCRMAVPTMSPRTETASATSPALLTLNNVSYTYGKVRALQDINLQIGPGEIFVLLGPNGAGKSTLTRLICGRLRPSTGKILLADSDPATHLTTRQQIGLVPQDLALFPTLTVAENLSGFARLAGLANHLIPTRVAAAAQMAGLNEKMRARVQHLSGGWQRRVNLAVALLTAPRLLILDEPTVGVDLEMRMALIATLRQMRDRGLAILLITHDLEQATLAADRVGLLLAGQLLLTGTPTALLAENFSGLQEVIVEVAPTLTNDAVLLALGLQALPQTGRYVGYASDGYAQAAALQRHLDEQQVPVRQILVKQPDLASLLASINQSPQVAA
jgi:ABC-2 type transport system ATP-binding protein